MSGARIAEQVRLAQENPGWRTWPWAIRDADRASLAEYFALCGYTVGAEVGVERALFSQVLLDANPALTLHCVDAWRPYPEYREHVTATKLALLYSQAKERLAPYGARAVVVHEWSVQAALDYRDGSLDFVYIDANHRLDHVIADLYAWEPKVRRGGVVCGHDYCQRRRSDYNVHVVEAVRAYTEAMLVRPWFVIGAKEKEEGVRRDAPRSWMWVKG